MQAMRQLQENWTFLKNNKVIIKHNIYRILNRSGARRNPPQHLKDRRNVSLKESRNNTGCKEECKGQIT